MKFQGFILDLAESIAYQENERLNLGISAVAVSGLCKGHDAIYCAGCADSITEYDWKQRLAAPLFFRYESHPDRLLVVLAHQICIQKVQETTESMGVKVDMQEGHYHMVDPTETN